MSLLVQIDIFNLREQPIYLIIGDKEAMPETINRSELLELTSEIVAAHASNNTVPAQELPEIIKAVFDVLSMLGRDPVESVRPEPAVAIKKSLTPDFIICLEDGKKLKMLKRHLNTAYGMSPDEYRKRWGLPGDYPMVAPNYAKKRSSLAKKIGLGRKPGMKKPRK